MKLNRAFGRQAFQVMAPTLRAYWHEMHPDLTPDEELRLEAHAALKMVDPMRHMMVAVDDDGVHGFVMITPVSGERNGGLVSYLNEIWVRPESRGTTEAILVLYSGAVRIAKETGARFLEATVSMHNHHVAGMLQKRGFEPQSTVYSKDLEKKSWATPTPTEKQKKSTSTPTPRSEEAEASSTSS